MSLSSWFRDYVYIPLGGSRVKRIRQFFNILVVWMLTGIIRRETGFVAESEANRKSHKQLHKALMLRAILTAAVSAIASVAMSADVFVRHFTDNYEQGTPIGNVSITLNGVALPIYGWFWLVVLTVRVIAAGLAIHTAATLSGEVEHKYMLD